MGLRWLLAVTACVVACAGADHGGSSLRGALEALQRRQRGRMHGPIAPQPDYESLYEFVPPQAYLEPDYPVDVEDLDDETVPKYFVKLANEDPRYQYKLIKKKNSGNSVTKKESAFRERSHHSDNESLRDLFTDKSDSEEDNTLDDNVDNDAEYAVLLGQLWSKYKYNKEHGNNVEAAPQGVVKLYKEKVVKKRYPDNWGPIAFKRKRSSELETNRPVLYDYDSQKNEMGSAEPNYNSYTLSDEDKDDLREEYAIAFQPLDDDSASDDEDQYTYDTVEKRFPVTKRSSSPYNLSTQKKRFTQSQNKRETSKTFRSSAGTDPKIMKDLSKIFGDTEIEIIKSPVKRSSDNVEHEHDPDHGAKPPIIPGDHNKTYEQNKTAIIDDDSHEHHGHNIHHPGISGKEVEHENMHNHDHGHDHNHGDKEKPIHIKKKSIDWSDYFGIDKRSKKPVTFFNDLTQDRLRKQYFDTFNKEVIYPLNTYRRHTNAKRNYMEPKPNDESEIQIDRAHLSSQKDEKRSSATDNDSKLDNIDKKLRNMEGLIVDEALHYSNVGADLDSKEEQEMKEKLLSRLAAAYSLEKMRKALKEFKQSLQIQKAKTNAPAPIPTDETKAKRVAVKKEKVELINNEIPGFEKGEDRSNDFEDEQGAGHYINGKMEDQFSEGYMGGSGRHRIPVMATVGASGSCPVLAKIVQRCRGVDLLAGDRGQLFLPHCSLHQICYLCGEAPPTTCDLVFLSEADTTCEGDMGCQRAARSTLMALRELHDSLADELDGECEASPCLPATLKLNIGWQRAFLR